MRKFIYLTAITGLLILAGVSAQATAPNAVELEFLVRQKPAVLDKYFEIIRDTAQILIGGTTNIMLVNCGIEINIEETDSNSVSFTSHLVTFGPSPFNLANRFRVEYNLPARIENIPGKNGSFYQILITPRQVTTIDTGNCEFRPGGQQQFTITPSANFDFYLIKNSLSDFYWNNIKSYLETDYTRFRDALEISTAGKMNYYLFPCASPSIHWDKRFGYFINPAKSSIYSVFGHGQNSVDAILPNMLRLLHLWGYAPPFLVEGLAGYFDFMMYDAKKIRKENDFPDIKKIITSAGYMASNPHIAEVAAVTFIKYLADTRGIEKIKKLYEQSDDLTIGGNIQEIYGISIDSLQQGWINYIDTLTFNRKAFDLYAARAGAIFAIDQQIEYYEQMTKYDQSRPDSIDTWNKLAMTYYQNGRYYKAEDGFRLLLKIDSARTIYRQILGNLALLDGRYDDAWKLFDAVIAADTTYASARLLQAKILAIKGDTVGAVKLAEDYYGLEKSEAGKIEFLLFLGKMHSARGKSNDSAAAEQEFGDALSYSSAMISRAPDEHAYKLRAGLALLGLKDYDRAAQFLELALFVEQRSFYLGEILLALGNLYDSKNEHAEAIKYYQEAMAGPLGAHQRNLCEKYINKPYSR
jgi:tetratricopeptide (TPR) repeat protein